MSLAAPDADEARRIQRSGVGGSEKRGPDGFAKTLFEKMINSTQLLAIDILPEGWQLGFCRVFGYLWTSCIPRFDLFGSIYLSIHFTLNKFFQFQFPKKHGERCLSLWSEVPGEGFFGSYFEWFVTAPLSVSLETDFLPVCWINRTYGCTTAGSRIFLFGIIP